MRKLILPWSTLLVAAVCILFFFIFQFAAGSELVLKKTETWKGVPVFAGWEDNKEGIRMKVLCDGKEGFIKEGKIIITYLENPNQPLPTLVLYEDGHVAVK